MTCHPCQIQWPFTIGSKSTLKTNLITVEGLEESLAQTSQQWAVHRPFQTCIKKIISSSLRRSISSITKYFHQAHLA